MTRPVTSTEPHTSNLYIAPITNQVIDKIDLLFMIDNSQSMGDKQALLAKAVPELVDRLVVPRCVNANGEVKARVSPNENCPTGYAAEFRAVKDIHVAVITSSLGAHGATSAVKGCGAAAPANDRALLLPKVRTNPPLSSYANTGFLAWDLDQKLMPPGDADSAHLGQQFSEMVKAAGEGGCGYEASLESWYRFLIDPEPPLSISVDADRRSVAGAVDTELLAQRAAFLRPDSLVAIVMLTDENDCSIRDDGFGNWLADGQTLLPRATSACEKDPNDPCCLPCLATGGIPEGCTPPKSDPACQAGNVLSGAQDPLNLRCLQNKRRYGYDFLYPTSRYVAGLTETLVARRSDGKMVENPLFASVPGHQRRNKALVYLAGIVGVPWQDVADDQSRQGAGLRYMTASELTEAKRWDVILGDASKNQPPNDPFMLESTAPRVGKKNPITQDPIVPETSLDPNASPINGHEQKVPDSDDLQYACTFKLAEPVACTGDKICDCHAAGSDWPDELMLNRPLCQPPGGGAAVATQYFGKAYPGLRPLEVLKGIGDSAIVASICPKVLTEGQPGYGYEPAVDAIVDRLKVALAGRCLPRPLAVEPGAEGKLPCVVVEAGQSQGACSCDTAQRKPASAEEQALVLKQLAERSECGTSDTPPCTAASFCLCELAQAEGPSLNECLNSELGSATPGYCYVNPYGDSPHGNKALVQSCDPASRQLIRFVGPDTPRPGATTFIACLGATLN